MGRMGLKREKKMGEQSVFPTMHERQVAHLIKENHNEIIRLRKRITELEGMLAWYRQLYGPMTSLTVTPDPDALKNQILRDTENDE
jgi:hypothetical protein